MAAPMVLLAALLFPVIFSACSSTAPRSPSRIDRLPASQEAPQAPAAPLSLNQLVSMVQAGASAEAVVERWRQDGARLRLTLADYFELRAKGIPMTVLEPLFEAQETARQTDCNSQLVSQQAQCSAQLAVERNRYQQCPAPPYYGRFMPYGGWGSNNGWGGGLYWGW